VFRSRKAWFIYDPAPKNRKDCISSLMPRRLRGTELQVHGVSEQLRANSAEISGAVPPLRGRAALPGDLDDDVTMRTRGRSLAGVVQPPLLAAVDAANGHYVRLVPEWNWPSVLILVNLHDQTAVFPHGIERQSPR